MVGEQQWMQAKAEAEQYLADLEGSPEFGLIKQMAEVADCDLSKPYQALDSKAKEQWRKLVNSALNKE